MYRLVVPRKHRKYVKRIIKKYKTQHHLSTIESPGDYVAFMKMGCEDGWLETNNKEYQSVVWMSENIELLEGDSND